MSSRPNPLDLRELGRILDEDADYDFLSSRQSSRPSSSRSAHPRPPPRQEVPRLSVGLRQPRGGGELFVTAAASRGVPRSVGGGSGVYSDPHLESPRGSDTPMPVVFISEQTVASTCRGLYAATSRFCIKKVIPGQHHCGTTSHKSKKFKIKGDTYWAPGGFVRGELVALCGECVEKNAIPLSMRTLFADGVLRSSAEWRNLIIDASIPTPSLRGVDSVAFSEEKGTDQDGEDAWADEEVDLEDEEPEVISLLGGVGDIHDFDPGEWEDIDDEYAEAEWAKHIIFHQGVIDGWCAKLGGVRSKLSRAVEKLDKKVIPTINLLIRKGSLVEEKQAAIQASVDHVATLVNVLDARVRAGEDMQADLEDCVLGVTDVKDVAAALGITVEDQATAIKDMEGMVASLIQKVNIRTTNVAKRVSTLEAKAGWVDLGDGDGDEARSMVSMGSRSREVAPAAGNSGDVTARLKTLEAKVEIQLERAKSQGVIFHKVAFLSEMEFMQWYMKENTSGKGLAAFVDLVSIWAFASLSNETAAEWLQSLSRQRSVGLDHKVEVEYSHSMLSRYPAAFVGKAELITSTQTFKIFEKLLLWRGGGVGDGVKERLLDSLRMAVESQRVYCEDMLPAGVLQEHAIRSAEFTWDFFQAFVVHIEDEITMLSSFGLAELQVMLLMSNQLMQICDDLFEFRHAAINVTSSNRTESGARYAWVSLQALGKMSEYTKAKFKHHPSITGTFVRFLTRQTADTSAAGLKAKLESLESTVKSLKTGAATKTELTNLHNKLDLVIAANELKKK